MCFNPTLQAQACIHTLKSWENDYCKFQPPMKNYKMFRTEDKIFIHLNMSWDEFVYAWPSTSPLFSVKQMQSKTSYKTCDIGHALAYKWQRVKTGKYKLWIILSHIGLFVGLTNCEIHLFFYSFLVLNLRYFLLELYKNGCIAKW